jgi:flagellar protein FlaF
MYAQQLETYANVHKTTLSGRALEAAVLNKAALKLEHIQENWDAQNREDKLNDALRYNQLIWNVFQSELAKADNPLPKKLREDILNLSLFIDRRTFETLAFPGKDKLSILININRNIAAGLSKEP